MTFARILQILLAGLFIGLLPLRAVHGQAPGGDGLPPGDDTPTGDTLASESNTLATTGGDGGVVILPVGDGLVAGGDGGVVILPSLNSDTSNVLALAQTLSDRNGEGHRVSVTVSLAGDSDVIRIKLPVDNPLFAVAYIDKYRIAWSVPIVANYLEIDRAQLRALADLDINRLEVLVVWGNGTVIGFSIKIEEATKAEKVKKVK